MQHCDDDVLALVALGEQPSAADAEHLAGCATCRAEVESFGRVVTAGRGERGPVSPAEPPARVWDGIAAATGVGVRPRTLDGQDAEPPAGPTAAPPASAPAPGPAPAPVLPLRPRRPAARFRGLHLVAVAAAALVLGGAAGIVGTRVLTEEKVRTVVVAQTVLDPLPVDPGASGKAVVVRNNGSRTLEVDVSRLAGTDGFYEVWLIDRGVKKMIPVGILTGRTGTFSIPADLDLGQYPVVDISAEPMDGNPNHSGKSLLRGVIEG